MWKEGVNMKKKFILGLVFILAVSALTGCGKTGKGGGSDDTTGSAVNEGSNTVVIAGSTSVQPLSEVLAEAFMDANSGIEVEVQGGGSGQGIKAIKEKIADFGALSREVKEEEKAAVAEEYVIAKDGVAVIVNSQSTVEDLTLEQIKQIYTGQITNWKEVGGKDAPIVVVTREEGSGTRGAFTEITGILAKNASGNEVDGTTKNALVQGSTGAVKQTVASTPDTIGYVSMGSLDDTVKAVSVEGIAPSSETVLSGEYKISRPFLYVTGGKISSAAQQFVDFVLSKEGQLIVEESGFIPVK